MLQQIQPSYFKWKDVLENGPKIYADMSQRGRWWCVTLQEDLPESTELFSDWDHTGIFDKRVQWTLDQLSNWPNVKRMSYDMWYFKQKRDAEKFQTLYNLKWASE